MSGCRIAWTFELAVHRSSTACGGVHPSGEAPAVGGSQGPEGPEQCFDGGEIASGTAEHLRGDEEGALPIFPDESHDVPGDGWPIVADADGQPFARCAPCMLEEGAGRRVPGTNQSADGSQAEGLPFLMQRVGRDAFLEQDAKFGIIKQHRAPLAPCVSLGVVEGLPFGTIHGGLASGQPPSAQKLGEIFHERNLVQYTLDDGLGWRSDDPRMTIRSDPPAASP